MKRAAFATFGAVVLVSAACQLVAGIEAVTKVAGDGGMEDETGSEVLSDPCEHASPPPQPDVDDDVDTELPPFFLALRSVSAVIKQGDSFPGFDLDKVCTCDTRPGTAYDGGSSCTARDPKKQLCDLDKGIDNQGASLFADFALFGSAIDETINAGVTAGARGLLFYVERYNGKRNDRDVEVGALLSYGIVDGSGCGTSSTGDDTHSRPGWCGKDLWTYPAKEVKEGSSGSMVPILRGKAHVNDGVLVMHTDLSLPIFFGDVVVSIVSPISVGKLEKNAAGFWTFSGMLTGRLPATDLLEGLGTFAGYSGINDGGLCQSFYFAPMKGQVCDSVDIARSPSFDFQDRRCDALSWGVNLTAEEALLGEERTEELSSGPCGRDKVAASLYECP